MSTLINLNVLLSLPTVTAGYFIRWSTPLPTGKNNIISIAGKSHYMNRKQQVSVRPRSGFTELTIAQKLQLVEKYDKDHSVLIRYVMGAFREHSMRVPSLELIPYVNLTTEIMAYLSRGNKTDHCNETCRCDVGNMLIGGVFGKAVAQLNRWRISQPKLNWTGLTSVNKLKLHNRPDVLIVEMSRGNQRIVLHRNNVQLWYPTPLNWNYWDSKERVRNTRRLVQFGPVHVTTVDKYDHILSDDSVTYTLDVVTDFIATMIAIAEDSDFEPQPEPMSEHVVMNGCLVTSGESIDVVYHDYNKGRDAFDTIDMAYIRMERFVNAHVYIVGEITDELMSELQANAGKVTRT